MELAREEYLKALRLGKKQYHTSLAHGDAPYLPVLDHMLMDTSITAQETLGLVEIPLDRIAGTSYGGRQQVFTHGFLPIAEDTSEFAHKWMNLCQAHLDSGIRDPIEAYEFMNYFYVVEGHKRVSVLRHFGAASVMGTVTRLIPEEDDTEESQIYAEFLRFYRITNINYLWFSRSGSFNDLLVATGSRDDTPWDEEKRRAFRSFYTLFSTCYREKEKGKLSLTVGDAILVYLNIYGYEASKTKAPSTIRMELSHIWVELCNKDADADIHLVLEPREARTFFPSVSPKRIQVAFIHTQTMESSSWTYAHELGRMDLEAAFHGQVQTMMFDHADSDEQAEQALETAISAGADLIFTTSPRLLNISVKTALKYPKMKILNCSLNTSHPAVRTYYARMYEAKFLMGVIAGYLTPDDNIGYIADYPIYGITANINAFARGAKMVNPRAKVFLRWSKTVEETNPTDFQRAGISYISDQDMITPEEADSRRVGLYHSDGTQLENTALTIWRWGKLYEKIVRNVLHGGWKQDINGTRAVNYWWGIDVGVIDLICSRSIPEEGQRLTELFRQSMCSGLFHPFDGQLTAQDGTIHDYRENAMTPEEIMTMDWLLENVVGELPAYDTLLPEAQALVRIQGIQKNEYFSII